MTDISRRGFLTGLGAAGAAAWATGPWAPLNAAAAPPPLIGVGTTLEAAAMPLGASGYRRLGAGPGWAAVVRTELAQARAGREDRRTALASIVQLTDVHLVDTQSPVRFEYTHPFISSAFRPQETLTTQGLVALVQRVNRLAAGPYLRRAFDAVVSTGDNTDNKEQAELGWFLTALNGGRLVPNTGAPDRYEGVQNSGADLYWNPESSIQDMYKEAGFPQIPGLLSAAISPLTSPGLKTPWFCVFGNHDDSVEGTLPSGIDVIDKMYTGSVKFEVPGSTAEARAVARGMTFNPNAIPAALAGFTSPARTVTPDPARKPLTPKQFIAAHLDPAHTGPGPVGHGFAPDAGHTGIGYYTFEIAPGVVGISMDSTNRAGFTSGSLGGKQFRWIEKVLKRGSSSYFSTSGSRVRTTSTDTWFVLFSHHTSGSMDNLLPDPEDPFDGRISGPTLVDLLHRFPNVLAWVNGHTHDNKITPWKGKTAQQSFWEINTASHIDFPQLGRIIEVADNADGTVSLLATLFEADSPYSVDHTDLSPAGLASIYREVSFNDIHTESTRAGTSLDRNVELVLEGRS